MIGRYGFWRGYNRHGGVTLLKCTSLDKETMPFGLVDERIPRFKIL